MWLVTALGALMCCWLACSEFIQVGEKEFVGDDPKLMKILHERVTHGGMKLRPIKLPRQYRQNERISKHSHEVYSGRRGYFAVDYDMYHGLNLRERTMDMMQHAVYLTQYRMRHLQRIVDKYSNDISFRVGFIYCKLDTIIRNMRVIYTVTNVTLKDADQKYRGVDSHVRYYAYFLKHNHDVTYIVEHMIKLHTDHVAKLKFEKKVKNKALGITDAPDELGEGSNEEPDMAPGGGSDMGPGGSPNVGRGGGPNMAPGGGPDMGPGGPPQAPPPGGR